jgi:hypothetical protein
MKKLLAVTAICALALPAAANANAADPVEVTREVEGCQVVNPGQPTCTYTATHEGTSPVSGIAAVGQWQVTFQVGKKKTVEKSPASGEPTVVEMTIPKGAKVTMEALSPGSAGTVGHGD